MKLNVGGIDRALRAIAGIGLIGWAVLDPESPKLIAGAVGAIALITGVMGWCPAYLLFGFSSCKTK